MAGRGPRPLQHGNTNVQPLTTGMANLSFRRGGKEAQVLTNYFTIKFGEDVKTIYCYDLLLRTNNAGDFSRRVIRQAVVCFLKRFSPPVKAATNYSNLLVTVQPLPATYINGEKIVKHVDEDDPPQGRPNAIDHTFVVERERTYNISRLTTYLNDPRANTVHFSQAEKDEVMTMLNIFFAHRPNQYTVRQLIPPLDPKVAQVGAFKFFSLVQQPEAQWTIPSTVQSGALDLGRGLEARVGFFRSVRCSSSKQALININRVTTAFYQPMNLSELLKEFLRYTTYKPRPGQNPHWKYARLEDADTFIRGIRVKTTHFRQSKAKDVKREERIHTINGLALDKAEPPTAKNVTFNWAKDGKEKTISITDFFSEHHGLGVDEDSYVVRIGGRKSPDGKKSDMGKKPDKKDKAKRSGAQGKEKEPIYLPAQYCEVLSGQAYRRLLSGEQVAEMIKFAAKRPNENVHEIETNGLDLFSLRGNNPDNPFRNFGLQVSTSMLRVNGHLLQPPTVMYEGFSIGPMFTKYGTWNLKGNPKFTRGAAAKVTWSILEIQRDDPKKKDELLSSQSFKIFFDTFQAAMKAYGIQDQAPRTSPADDYAQHRLLLGRGGDAADREKKDHNAIKAKLEEFLKKADVKLLFVVIPSKDADLYSHVKAAGDVETGLITICAVSRWDKENWWGPKLDPTTVANYMMKVNLKLGGTNQMISRASMPFDQTRTMFMGMDVTHPGPLSLNRSPSIATVVSTIEGQYLGQWPASIRTQIAQDEAKSKEIIDDLGSMVRERLQAWKVRNNFLPERIIIYRDGVSEGQFDQVRDQEFPQIDSAIVKEYQAANSPKPKLLLMCAIKRHHTRLYPPPQSSQSADIIDNRTGNFHPGLLVDEAITYETGTDWFLQSHAALQGTAVPSHYKVIKNELGDRITIQAIQQMTHDMCYLFGRCTKSVSIHPAAYYADLACERVRVWMRRAYVRHTGRGQEVDYDPNHWDQFSRPHPTIADRMWYI